MRDKLISQEPFASIVSEEWQRAKEILPWHLAGHKKVKFVWGSDYTMGNAYGRCFRIARKIFIHNRYKELQDESWLKEFRDTVRHEVAHLRTTGHGQDFMEVLAKLGGSRYVSATFPKRKPIVKPVAPKLPARIRRFEQAQRLHARWLLARIRAERMEKKWRKKLRYYSKQNTPAKEVS